MTSRPDRLSETATSAAAASTNQGEQTGASNSLTWYDLERVSKPLLRQIGHNDDGTVTRDQMAEAVQDPNFHGLQAEALAALYGEFQKISKLGGGDGKSINDKSVTALQESLFNTETNTSSLIALDDWSKSHLPELAKDSNGRATKTEIDTAADQSSGRDQQMLKMLSSKFNQISEHGGVTSADVTSYVDKHIKSDQGLHFADSVEQTLARASLAESNLVTHDIFADSQHPEKSIGSAGVHQGKINDCNFNAPLDSLAGVRPEDVASMINKNKDGSFDVKFPGAKEAVHIAAPTSAQEGIFDNATPSGTWAPLLEKAYGQLKIDTDPNLKGTHLLPQEVIDKREPLIDAIRILTGHEVGHKDLLYTSKMDVSDILQQSFNGPTKKVISLGTASFLQDGTTRDGFELNHGFSVLGYKPDGHGDGEVIVRDPYGVGGPKNDGVRSISVQQLKDNFTDIAFEK